MLEASGDILIIFIWNTIINALSRFYFDKLIKNNKLVVSTALWVSWGVLLVLTLVILMFGGHVSKILTGSTDFRWVCTLSFISVFIKITSQVGGTYLLMTHRSITYSTVGILQMILGISLNIILIIVLRMGLIGVVITSAISAFVSSIIFNSIAIKNCGLGFDRIILKKMMVYSLPLIPGDIVSYLSRQAERFMIRYIGGLSLLGILEMGYKWAPLMVFLIVEPFFRFWDPKRLNLAENDPNAGRILGDILIKFATILFFVTLLFANNIGAVIHLLTPSEFWKATNIATIEILSAAINAIFFHLNFGFYFKKKTGQYSLIITIISAVKIGLSFIIIKTWGINGAAVSACVAITIQLIVCTIIGQRLFKIWIEYRKLIFLVLVVISLYFLTFLPLVQNFISLLANSFSLPTLPFQNNKYMLKMTDLIATRQIYIWQMVVNTIIAMVYLPFAYIIIPETRAIVPLIKNIFVRKMTTTSTTNEQCNSNDES